MPAHLADSAVTAASRNGMKPPGTDKKSRGMNEFAAPACFC